MKLSDFLATVFSKNVDISTVEIPDDISAVEDQKVKETEQNNTEQIKTEENNTEQIKSLQMEIEKLKMANVALLAKTDIDSERRTIEECILDVCGIAREEK